MFVKRDIYATGIKCAERLYRLSVVGGDTLESLIEEVDWYKNYAIIYGDQYFAGLADGLWSLIQEHWEYVPRGKAMGLEGLRNDT